MWNYEALEKEGVENTDSVSESATIRVADATIIEASWKDEKIINADFTAKAGIELSLDIGGKFPLKFQMITDKQLAKNLFVVGQSKTISDFVGKKIKVVLGVKEKYSKKTDDWFLNNYVVQNGYFSEGGFSATEVLEKATEPKKILERLAKAVDTGIEYHKNGTNSPAPVVAQTAETEDDLPF